MKDLNSRLDEEIANASKAAKRDVIRLQTRVPTLCVCVCVCVCVRVLTLCIPCVTIYSSSSVHRLQNWRRRWLVSPRPGQMPRKPSKSECGWLIELCTIRTIDHMASLAHVITTIPRRCFKKIFTYMDKRRNSRSDVLSYMRTCLCVICSSEQLSGKASHIK